MPKPAMQVAEIKLAEAEKHMVKFNGLQLEKK
jgi:hypothetical protein